MRKFRRVSPVRVVPRVAIFVLLTAPAFYGQAPAVEDWAAPAKALEKKIAEKLKPRESVSLTVQNLSSLSPDGAAQVSKELEMELRAQGIKLKPVGKNAPASSEEGAAEIRVTLAENSQGLLWVAAIDKGDEPEVVMQAVARPANTETPAGAPSMILQSQMLLAQETPILDFALLGLPTPAANHLMVLEPTRVALYAQGQGGWQIARAASIPASDQQRDLRGSLRINPLQVDASGKLSAVKDSFSAILPGKICRGAWDTLALNCEFTGRYPWDEKNSINWPALSPDMQEDATSYSVVRIQVKGKWMEVAAGKDSVIRLYRYEGAGPPYMSGDRKGPIATLTGWGSDLAALKTGCGSGWQILGTRTGDYTEWDAVQAFEIMDRKAVPASPPVEFGGPVMSLRPSVNKDAAFAVVKNLQTGKYEAYVLSLSCGH